MPLPIPDFFKRLRKALRRASNWLLGRRGAKSARDAVQGWVRKYPLEALGAGIVIMAVVGLAGYVVFKRPGDITNPSAIFQASLGPTSENLSSWPVYGHDDGRTKFLPAKGVDPPFEAQWRYEAKKLLEFPPVYADGTLYGINNDALFFALDAKTGQPHWQRTIGSLNASSPAFSEGKLFAVTLAPQQAVAVDAGDGHTLWKKSLPGRAESSPLVADGRVYFGCENGDLFAVDPSTGKTIWTTKLGGAIKAAPALSDGVLFVGDYGGQMSAVRASNGKIVWQTGAQGASFGRTGQFYSTPALAYGRVYSGNNDGRLYSFEQKSGDLAWSRSLGGYVYSGPAVADTSDTDPTVYVGSFDGRLHALDAQNGEERWSADAGGRVSGAVGVIDHTVYISTFDDTATRGFDIKSHKEVVGFTTGAYTPVISDGKWVYLTGYSSIQALKPVDKAPPVKKKGGTAKK
jgi:outer membrane protein assembly factor BamB